MQKIDARITTEVDDLVEVGQRLNRSASTSSRGVAGDELAELAMWVSRLGHLIQKLYGEKSQHFASYNRALATPSFYNLHSNCYEHFTQVVGVAKAIQHDIKRGLLVDFKSQAQAEVFADFLAIGGQLLSDGHKDAAAVIVGSVLEDGLRKLAERAGLSLVTNAGQPLTMDALNMQLAKADVYAKLVQQQITSWAHIRDNAVRGEFSTYTLEQVNAMLSFAQSFLSDHLA